LRITKCLLVVIALMFAISGCKSKSDVPRAAEYMKKTKEVRIGTDPVNLPFEFGKGTDVQGIDVEIGNEIAKDLNYAPAWHKIQGYDHLYEILGVGDIEILISTLVVDPKREDKFSFSTPYYESEDAIASRFDNRYEDLASLSGKKVGVATGRPGEKFMSGQKGVTIVKFPTLDLALGALGRTEVDAVIGDRQVLTYSTATSFPNLVVSPTQLNNKYKYAVVVRKTEPEMLESINKTIERLRNSGKLTELNSTWYEEVRKKGDEIRDKFLKEEALKKSAKTISVTLVNNRKDVVTDSLEGFELVLEGPSGQYKSTPLMTNGNRGTCKFTKPIPPGVYTLDMMRAFRTSAKVEILPLPKSALAMDISVGREINIIIK
jgi:ABC-type amino acid transport substrate-binding protein